MSKRPPNRYSKQHDHNQYGIKNWFVKIGITNPVTQKGLKQMFLEDFSCRSEKEQQQNNFIQARWQLFTRYMQKNIPLYRKYILKK